MTKETYFEMCSQLGSQPIAEEIPLELGDFPIEIQQIFLLYEKLEDKISDFSGVFIGKSFSGFPYFYEHYCDQIPVTLVLDILKTIEQLEVEQAIKKSKNQNKVDVPRQGL